MAIYDLNSFKIRQFEVECKWGPIINAEYDIEKRYHLYRKMEKEIADVWEDWPESLVATGFPGEFHDKVQSLLKDVPDKVYENMNKLYAAVKLLRECY